MSPLAKVFVFLVTFLNICFLGVSATLYQVQKDWKSVAENRQAAIEELEGEASAELASIRGERDQAAKNLAAVKTTNASLEASNQSLNNESRDLKSDKERLEQTVATRDTSLQQKDTFIQQLDKEKSDLIVQNDRLRDEKESAEKDKTTAELAMARARLDLQHVEEQASQYQEQLAQVSANLDEVSLKWTHAVQKIPNLPELVAGAPAAPVDAAIVAVKTDVDLVVLSAGAEDQVKIGDMFTVYRGGNFIAKCKVIRTTPDLAGARIMYTNDGQSIQVGDSASSRMAY